MFQEKLNSINVILSKSIPVESTITSGHLITFLFENNKSTTLDFDQDYLRDLKEENIQSMIDNYDLINLISNNNYKTILISEKGAVPHHKKT